MVAQLQELVRAVAAAHAELLEPDELADAVVHVDDQVADLQVAQVREEGLGDAGSPLDRVALLVEDVALDVDLQAGIDQAETAGHGAHAHEHRRDVGVLGAVHGHGQQLVLAQDLDDAFGAALALGQEQHLVAALAGPPHVGHPLVDPAVELGGGLAAHLADARRGLVALDAERLEPRRALEPRPTSRPRRRTPPPEPGPTSRPRASGVGVAAVQLLAHAGGRIPHFVELGHQERRARGGGEVEERHGLASSSNRSTAGTISTTSTGPTERCESGSKRRSDSTMSPTNSMRTGCTSEAGKTSRMPPRSANEPCSVTGSSRAKPAPASRSARSCGAISVPGRISIADRSTRAGVPTRGTSAAADATIRRAFLAAAM